jgi:CHAT domain-containing protein
VEYSVLPDRTYIWIVGQQHFDMITRRVERATIEGWSTSLARLAREHNANTFRKVIETTGDALIAEPLKSIQHVAGSNELSRIVFIPDRSIHGLPLAGLYDRSSGRYVLEEHLIEIAASATFYIFSLERDRALAADHANASVLLVGNPTFDPHLALAAGLKNLPWAASEVAQLEKIYAPAAIMLPEEKATAPNFLRLAPQSWIVHFAGHAVANPEAPFRSLLLLAPSRTGDRSQNDTGVLLAEDLLRELRADRTRLVVLSACSSAGGVPIGPEGLAPLVRPLIAIGVPAVVGTLWKVDDHVAASLFVRFHRHFRDGKDAAQALRLAQLELLHKTDSAYAPALVWAPYQVIGHVSSPYQ